MELETTSGPATNIRRGGQIWRNYGTRWETRTFFSIGHRPASIRAHVFIPPDPEKSEIILIAEGDPVTAIGFQKDGEFKVLALRNERSRDVLGIATGATPRETRLLMHEDWGRRRHAKPIGILMVVTFFLMLLAPGTAHVIYLPLFVFFGWHIWRFYNAQKEMEADAREALHMLGAVGPGEAPLQPRIVI